MSHVRYNDLAAAEAAINEQTAAVIIELVQGEGGVHIATQEYVDGLASLCRERGALLIVDEVQTGFGRTGCLFACNHYDLQPDILCLAKSLAGGIPMGAVCLGPRVTESGRITGGIHGSTFGGNPLACAAALATLDILEREALPERSAALGARALQRLSALLSPLIREVRGRGLLLGVELKRRAQPYLESLLEQGVLALPAGPNVIRLLPPLVITEEQLERVVDCLAEVLGSSLRNDTDAGRVRTQGSRISEPVMTTEEGERGRPQGFPLRPSATPAPTMTMEGEMESGRRPQGSSPYSSTAPASTMTTEVALLHNMLTIPSYSGQEGALAEYLVGQARQMGLHACVDEVGNFVASTVSPHEVNTGSQPVILLGHMDTVRGYIPVRLQEGVLYGRGAVDAKGPLAAFVCAAARLTDRASSASLHHPVVVIGAVEEEAATSRGARAVVERYRPVACVIGEPSGSQSMTIGYKGRLIVEYRVTRPMHHSAGPGQNSSEAAVKFWNRAREHAAGWNQQHATNSMFAALAPSLRGITSSQDGLEEQTRMVIGYRLPPGYDIAGLRTQLERRANEDGAELIFSGEEKAFQTTRSTPLARAFITAMRTINAGQSALQCDPATPLTRLQSESAGLKSSSFKYKTGTSDMNVVGPVWGQNILAYGPGDARLDHTPQEHIHIAEYTHAIDVLEFVLRELALQGGTTQ